MLAVIVPRRIPRFLRRFGRSVGDLGRMGKELATGEEVEKSPLARYEVGAGELVATKLLAENPLTRDEALQKRISDIGARLALQALRKEIPYRFAVVESAVPNAFAVPGGSIFITRPLLELCEHEPNRIACVLGHEIIHVDRRHAVQNLAASVVVRTGLQVISLGRAAILSRLAGGIEQLFVQGYRQDQELEADRFGVRIARRSGFDPRAMIELLERLGRRNPGGMGTLAEVFQYFKSHPPLSERIANLSRELGERA
jgi:predicted Zn-dependent protease